MEDNRIFLKYGSNTVKPSVSSTSEVTTHSMWQDILMWPDVTWFDVDVTWLSFILNHILFFLFYICFSLKIKTTQSLTHTHYIHLWYTHTPTHYPSHCFKSKTVIALSYLTLLFERTHQPHLPKKEPLMSSMEKAASLSSIFDNHGRSNG